MANKGKGVPKDSAADREKLRGISYCQTCRTGRLAIPFCWQLGPGWEELKRVKIVDIRPAGTRRVCDKCAEVKLGKFKWGEGAEHSNVSDMA